MYVMVLARHVSGNQCTVSRIEWHFIDKKYHSDMVISNIWGSSTIVAPHLVSLVHPAVCSRSYEFKFVVPSSWMQIS
jgi:hypothetical protein